MSPDTTPVKTEVANLNQVMVQYLNPIMLGMVSDIDKAFADLDARLKAAGIDRVLAEFRRQTQAFLAGQNKS